MFINGLLEKVNLEKRRIERMRTAHHMAAGMCIIMVAGVCAAAGFLLCTKSGKELREKMKDKANDTVGTVKHFVIKSVDAAEASAAETADKIGRVIETAQDKAEEIKTELKDGAEEIKNDVRETAEKISESI